MSIRQLGVVLAVAGGWFAAGPSEAAAKVVLITRGEQIREFGPVSLGVRGDLPAGVKVGYKNSYFGFFWLDCWTWGGTHCIYNAEGYEAIDEPTAAMLLGNPGQPVGTPFLYRFPLMLIILAGLAMLVAVLRIGSLIEERRNDKKAAQLLEQPEYQAAAKLLDDATPPPASEGAPPPTPENAAMHPAASAQPGYEAAVAYLVDSGVERQSAGRNLNLIVHARRRGLGRAVPPGTMD